MTALPGRYARPLTAAQMSQLDLVETIMIAPLDQAVTVAVGRASTCWSKMDGSGVFDDQTAIQIVNALLSRISAELAVESANAHGEDAVKALIPTISMPTGHTHWGQCPEAIRLEGTPVPSQCLLLEAHDGTDHQNGNLRWRKDMDTGEITAWWDTQVYETVGLGDLLRSGVHLTLPHLSVDSARGDVNTPLTPIEAPEEQ